MAHYAQQTFIARSNRYGVLYRARSIFREAPWSNHDLLVGLALMGIGLGFLVNPEALTQLRALAYLNAAGSWTVLGASYLCMGSLNLLVTLWPSPPSFPLRLFSRMAGAFGFLTLALSNMHFAVLIPSTIVYVMVAVWSLWGVLRTQGRGR